MGQIPSKFYITSNCEGALVGIIFASMTLIVFAGILSQKRSRTILRSFPRTTIRPPLSVGEELGLPATDKGKFYTLYVTISLNNSLNHTLTHSLTQALTDSLNY